MKESLYTLRWLVNNFWGKDEGRASALSILDRILGEEKKTFSDKLEKKVALVVGHSSRDKGAVAVDGTKEWNWNKTNAEMIQKELSILGVDSFIFYRKPNLGYSHSMVQLAKEVKNYGADVAIELHFNSFNEKSNGTEAVVSGSKQSVLFARSVLSEWAREFPLLALRRDRGVFSNPNGRGSGFNNRMHCPSIVWEPLFGSNPSEWKKYGKKQLKMSKALAKGVFNYLK